MEMLKPIPPEDRVAKPCDICGNPRPFHKRNASGVPGWNSCTLHKAAPELLEAVEQSYVILGGISNQWTGRHTIHGQSVLVNLRDAICAATGREAQEVQDDYCNRAAIAKARLK